MTKMISGGPNVSHQLCMPGWHEGEKEGEKRKKGKDGGFAQGQQKTVLGDLVYY